MAYLEEKHQAYRSTPIVPLAVARMMTGVKSTAAMIGNVRINRIFIVSVTLFLALGALYVVLSPSLYQASTTLLIDPRLGKKIGVDPNEAGFMIDSALIDSQVMLLKSEAVLLRAAQIANLRDDIEFNRNKDIFGNDLSLQNGVNLKKLANAVSVKRAARDYLVTVDVVAREPKKAAEIANALVQAYFQDQIEARGATTASEKAYVEKRLAALADETKDAVLTIELFKTLHNVVDMSGLRSNEQQVADLTKSLGLARIDLSEAQSSLDEVKQLASAGRLDASVAAISSRTIESLRQQETESQKELATLTETSGPNHPALIEAEKKETAIELMITEELGRVREAAESRYLAARSKLDKLAESLDRAKAQSSADSTMLIPLTQLEQKLKSKRAAYDQLARIDDNLMQQEGRGAPARVVAVAHPNASPVAPKKTLILVLCLGLGAFVGFILSMLSKISLGPQ